MSKQKKLNKECRSLSYTIAGYALDLAFWDDVEFNELEMTRLNYFRKQIEELWAEKTKLK